MTKQEKRKQIIVRYLQEEINFEVFVKGRRLKH